MKTRLIAFLVLLGAAAPQLGCSDYFSDDDDGSYDEGYSDAQEDVGEAYSYLTKPPPR